MAETQVQKIRRQQTILLGQKRLSSKTDLQIQQQSLQTGQPVERIIEMREQQRRLTESKKSVAVNKINIRIKEQEKFLQDLIKREQSLQRTIDNIKLGLNDTTSSRGTRENLSRRNNIVNAELTAVRQSIPVVRKNVQNLNNIERRAVNAQFSGRKDIAENLSKDLDRAIVSTSDVNTFISSSRRAGKKRDKARRKRSSFLSAQKKFEQDFGKSLTDITLQEARKLSPKQRRSLGVKIVETKVPIQKITKPQKEIDISGINKDLSKSFGTSIISVAPEESLNLIERGRRRLILEQQKLEGKTGTLAQLKGTALGITKFVADISPPVLFLTSPLTKRFRTGEPFLKKEEQDKVNIKNIKNFLAGNVVLLPSDKSFLAFSKNLEGLTKAVTFTPIKKDIPIGKLKEVKSPLILAREFKQGDPLKTDKTFTELVGGFSQPSGEQLLKPAPFEEFGKEIKTRPGVFTTEVLLFAAAPAAFEIKALNKIITSAGKITSKARVPTRITVSSSVGDAVKIKQVGGLTEFKVTTRVKTNVLNRKTGQSISKFDTFVESRVITGTKGDAIKSVSRSVSATLKEKTQQFNLAEATGSATLQSSEDFSLLTGKFKGVVEETGTFDLFGRKGEGIFAKEVRSKAKPRTEILGDVEARIFKTEDVTKRIKGLDLAGTSTIIGVKTRADVIPKTLRVKGSKRKVKKDLVDELLQELGIRQKTKSTITIQPFTRQFPKTVKGGKVRFEKSERGLGLEISKTFEPKISKFDKNLFFKPSKKRKQVTETIKGLTLEEQKNIAKIVGETEAKGVAQVQVSKALVKSRKASIKASRISGKLKEGQLFKTEQKITSKLSQGFRLGVGTKFKLGTKQREAQDFALTSLDKGLFKNASIERLGDKLKEGQQTRAAIKLRTQQRTTQVNITGTTTIIKTPTITGGGREIPPEKITPIPPFGFGRRKTKLINGKERRIPYDTFIKGRKISDNLNKRQAQDFGAFVSDHSIAAQFSIRRSKGKLKRPPFRVSNSYFAFNRNKFRSFQLKKGKKIPLKNKFIERSNRRLDTAGEIAQITAARFIAQQRRRFKGSNVNILGRV